MHKCPACTASFFFESNLKKHAESKHRLNNYDGVMPTTSGVEYFDNTMRVRRVPREAANMWISSSQILDAGIISINDPVSWESTPYITSISSLAQSIDYGVLDAVRLTSSNNTR